MAVSVYERSIIYTTFFITFSISWLEGALPYFPCDISLSALGFYSGNFFAVSSGVLALWCLWKDETPQYMIVPVIGCCCLAVFTTANHLFLHTFGVWLFLTGTIFYSYQNKWRNLHYVWRGCLIWSIRFILRVTIVIAFELSSDCLVNVYKQNNFSTSQHLFSVGDCIKTSGIRTLTTPEWHNPIWTPFIIKFTAILQWYAISYFVCVFECDENSETRYHSSQPFKVYIC